MRDLEGKAKHILSTAESAGVPLRLIGALAFKIRCKSSNKGLLSRSTHDIDLVGHAKDRDQIDKLFRTLEYTPAELFNHVHPNRLLFFDPHDDSRVEVFLDDFEMCHAFNFRDRIHLSRHTLTPSDLLVTKLQIVELNEKDLKDIISLVNDHRIGFDDDDDEAINVEYIAGLCAKDWCIYKTFSRNLKRILEILERFDLADEDKRNVIMKLKRVLDEIETFPKTLKWKLRSILGTRLRWYSLPEVR